MIAVYRFAVALALLCSANVANAQEPLDVGDVLASVVATHPKMVEAEASIEFTRGQSLTARRALEPKVGVSASAVPAGYYNYWQMAATVEQRVPSTGAKILGGYRLGRGDIPTYYGERETRDGGELFAKVNVPLLANRSIDKERAEMRKTRIGTAQASFAMESTWLAIARKASLAYWEWSAAGQKLRVAEELVGIAQDRADRIRKQAESGAYPRIAVVDAETMVLDRQSKRLQARGKFLSSQQKLSLVYRSPEGIPIAAGLDRVPMTSEAPKSFTFNLVETWIEAAIARRPELRVAESQMQLAKVDRALARNKSLPTLDANAFVARDLGVGADSLGQTDVGMGLTLSIPLFQREGRGLEKQAQAKVAIIEAKQRGLRDQIRAAILQSAQLAILAQERRVIALDRLAATEQLAEAERERILQGSSNLLTLNLRELDVAAAANEVIESTLEAHRASVELAYSRGAIAR
tara:strand:- start:15473 stop:16870 length:1398 start_codon:yes stop_codon:yes gene_type:complete